MPSTATAARAKRPITYGKQARNTHRDLAFDQEVVSGPGLNPSLSKLSTVAMSPKANVAAMPHGDSASFDIPSSEDESHKQRDSKHRLSPKVKGNQIPTKDAMSRFLFTHSSSTSDNSDGLSNQLRTATFSSAVVSAHLLETKSHRTRETSPNILKIQKKKKRKVEDRAEEDPEVPHPRATLRPEKPTRVQYKRRKVAETRSVRQKPAEHATIDAPPVDLLWDIPASNSDTDVIGSAKKLPNRVKVRATEEIKVAPDTRASKTSLKNPRGRAAPRTPKSSTPHLPLYDQGGFHEQARGPSTPVQVPPTIEISVPNSPYSTPPAQTEGNSTPSSQPRGVNTPRQARLWKNLLNDNRPAATPSHDLELLNLDRKEAGDAAEETPRRRRLIDTLMPSALPSSDEAQESDIVSASEESDQNGEAHASGRSKDFAHETAFSQVPRLMRNTYSPPVQQTRIAAGGPKFTYGGQRTHLADSNDTLENILTQPIDVETSPATMMPRTDQPGALWKGTALEVFHGTEDDEDMTRAVRTIHDLRAGGDSERFADEVSEIVDGLDANKATVSRKRGAILELCQKLGDPMFRTRFVNSGYEFRVFSLCSTESDAIIGAAAAAAVILILGSEGSLCNPCHVHDAGIFTTLTKMLNYKNDLKSIAKDRRSNMSKVAQGSVEKLTNQLANIPLWKNKRFQCPSPMTLALCALDLSIRKLREVGNADALLERGMISKLLDILDTTLQGHRNGKLDDLDAGVLDQLETVLSILESCTTVSECALDSSLWDERSLERLVKNLDSAMAIEMPREQLTQRLIPRLSLNLANNSERTSQKFAKGSYIQRLTSRILLEFDLLLSVTEDSMDLDILLLSLGAMLNLAECSDEIRKTVIRNGTDVLDSLIRVFLRGRKQAGEADSLAASQANVAYGWLAVLLGNLCQNAIIREQVRNGLPGRGLSALVDAVDEFILHHKEADKRAQSNEAYVAFTKRLQSVAEMIRSL